MRKKRYIRTRIMFALMVTLFFSTCYVQAEESGTPIYHHHCSDCEGIEYRIQDASNAGSLVINWEDTCPYCGAMHHYYHFSNSCSCGRSWESDGHACYNSPYGTGQGSCGNYSVIDCNTSHSHPVKTYVCGKTEESIIGTVCIKADETDYTKEVSLICKCESEEDITFGEKNWNTGENTDEIKVTENGIYTCETTYFENGQDYPVTALLEISNIDKTMPKITSFNADKTEPTNEKVTIRVEAKDEQSGLANRAYSFNETSFTEDNELEVSENGTYHVWVQDKVGNTATAELVITNIDCTAPTVSLSANPAELENQCIIKAIATDNESGLAITAYSWDEGETWVEDAEREVTKAGSDSCFVRDCAGNKTVSEITIRKKAPAPPPSASEVQAEPAQPLNSEVPSEVQTVPAKEKAKEVKPSSTASEEEETLPSEVSTPSQIKKKVVITLPETNAEELEENELKQVKETVEEQKDTSVVTKVLIGTGSLVGGTCILYALYFFLCTAKIYSKSGERLQYLGRCIIHRKNCLLFVRVDSRLWNKAEGPILRVKLSAPVYRVFKGKSILIQRADREFQCQVKRVIEI